MNRADCRKEPPRAASTTSRNEPNRIIEQNANKYDSFQSLLILFASTPGTSWSPSEGQTRTKASNSGGAIRCCGRRRSERRVRGGSLVVQLLVETVSTNHPLGRAAAQSAGRSERKRDGAVTQSREHPSSSGNSEPVVPKCNLRCWNRVRGAVKRRRCVHGLGRGLCTCCRNSCRR